MKPFTFVKPHSVEEAVKASTPDRMFIGGGTSLGDLMNENVLGPSTLIDINAQAFSKIETDGKKVRIGALAPQPLMTTATAFPLLLALLLPWATAPSAETAPSLPHVFGDHMVLQTGAPVPIWGRAAPGAVVTVTFAGQRKQATAAPGDGAWRVILRTPGGFGLCRPISPLPPLARRW